MGTLLLGLVTGIFFGFALQKGQALQYDRQVGMLRLQDFWILKMMFTAILVGMIGVHLFVSLGWAELSIKPVILGANILGGVIFGLGWGLLGYCPGTAVGAIGEGRLDAFFGGVLGMFVGAGIYAEAYTCLKDSVLKWGDLGKLTFAKILNVNPWVVIAILGAGGILLFRILGKRGR